MYSLSSATIPDDMTMSCCSIIEKFEDLEASQSEKDVLLRRLGELIETERQQVEQDIALRRKQLLELEEEHKITIENIKISHRREEQKLVQRHQHEKNEL